MTNRGAVVRRVLVAILAIAATLAIIGSLQRPAAAPPRARTNALGSSLWSMRRTPQPVTDAVGAQHLQAALQSQTNGNRACFVVQDDLGLLATANADQALTPASTIKLLTATAALDTLGPNFHFTTKARASAPPRNGSVDHLYLLGDGDPLLATPERIAQDQLDPDTAGLPSTPLATLADHIKAAGVSEIPGGVVGVDSRYDRVRYVPEWPASTRAAIGPIGALTVNDGFSGVAGTGAVASDPALNAATELTRLLTARGVKVGTPSRGDPPQDSADVASIDSPLLPMVLTEMLSASDNLSAEMLVRELGASAGEGTTTKGTQATLATVKHLGIPTATVTMVDGSGLSSTDAVPCVTLQAVLELSHQPKFAPIRDALAIAGQRGTLATRFANTALVANLRAKTGTLTGVSGLAGFLTSDRPLTFSILLNGAFGEATAFALRETMATTIAGFPRTTLGPNLVPAPNAPIPPRACPRVEPAC